MQSTPLQQHSSDHQAETIMGSIMALMTGYIQSHNPHHRELISNKLCMLMQQLHDNPHISESFKSMLMRMEVHWSLICEMHAHDDAQALPSKWYVPNSKGALLC